MEGVMTRPLRLASLILFCLVNCVMVSQTGPCSDSSVCVLTWQQDTSTDIGTGYVYRTGQNLSESVITASSISTDSFGQLCSLTLDGHVYAQPLVATNVKINNVTYRRVVYVVTEKDTLYAIDG